MKNLLKKSLIVFLASIMVFAFTGCGGEIDTDSVELGDNAIAEICNDGFESCMSSADEKEWKAIFIKDDSYDKVYLATAKMSEDLYESYNSISYDDEQQEEKQIAFVTKLEDAEVKDITDEVPTQKDLDKYVGKKISTLVAKGYERSGDSADEIVEFFYDGPKYSVTVSVGKLKKWDPDEFSEKDIEKLKIKKITFTGFSSMFLDNL